ncbi:hypothetical protein TNCT_159861 [Trichonephila clavata]|uniref:Uncharacterized protein n=1 Tax=Trichonephila clavata TaxID=2740835 RepID=A0A8X6FRY8_TRICU|nr:hypothetical protein TNCT_159861 [Trichonephila clavata]
MMNFVAIQKIVVGYRLATADIDALHSGQLRTHKNSFAGMELRAPGLGVRKSTVSKKCAYDWLKGFREGRKTMDNETCRANRQRQILRNLF